MGSRDRHWYLLLWSSLEVEMELARPSGHRAPGGGARRLGRRVRGPQTCCEQALPRACRPEADERRGLTLRPPTQDLDAPDHPLVESIPLYEKGPSRKSPPCFVGPRIRCRAMLISLSPPRAGGPDRVGACLGGPSPAGVVYATKGFAGPAGANGWLRVSMYQIASASLRAISTRATLVPRCRPRRRFVCS